jgi:hypothetical protein
MLLTGCNTTATVSCNNIGMLQTGMGLLNSEGVVLGNLIDLDPVSKHAAFQSGLRDFDSTKDVTIAPDSDESDISSDSALNISFSATLSAAESAALTSALTQDIQLKLTNSNRHQISLPVDVLNRAANKALLATVQHPGHTLVLVVAGNTSESATFALKNGSTNELKIAVAGKNFDLQVNYQCQGSLNQTVSADRAKSSLTFFKIVQVVANNDGSFTTEAFPGKLTDYDLSAGAIPAKM